MAAHPTGDAADGLGRDAVHVDQRDAGPFFGVGMDGVGSGREVVDEGGIGVTMAVYAPGAGAGQPLLGTGLQLAATFCGAVGVILFGKIKPTMGSRAATGTSLGLGGLGLILLAFPAWGRLGELFDGFVLVWTLWLAFVSAAAFSLWNHLSTLYPVPLLASYRFLIPVCGVVESLLFLKTESAGWGLIAGGSLVIGSIVWAQRADQTVNSK